MFDISYMRVVPNMTVAAPRDENELQHMLYTAIYSGAPLALRYPRGTGLGVPLDQELRIRPIGHGEVLHSGRDLVLFAYGSMVGPASEASAKLARQSIDCGVVNARFEKPLDRDLLVEALKTSSRILTVEEHMATGGFGAAVLEAVEALGIDRMVVRVHAIPDQFIEHAPQAVQRASFGLDANGIVAAALRAFPDLPREEAVDELVDGSMERENITW